MIEIALALQLSIGVGKTLNKEHGFNTLEQDGGLAIWKVEKTLTKDFSVIWIHASEWKDGLKGTQEDRDYIGVMYNF